MLLSFSGTRVGTSGKVSWFILRLQGHIHVARSMARLRLRGWQVLSRLAT